LYALVLLTIGGWSVYEWHENEQLAPGGNQPSNTVVAAEVTTSQSCVECHKSRHASWQRSFHRSMTRDATPENVKADFNDAVYTYQGITSRMYRRGDEFFIETMDPAWANTMQGRGLPQDQWGPPKTREFSVDRLVGSHWFQQMFHRDKHGRYIRLPLIYHLVEKRWIHASGAFLAPETPIFFGHAAVWNDVCLFCHNTRPDKKPLRFDGGIGYQTEVSELGISCEQCHGPGDRHILAHKNSSATSILDSSGADPTIANPARLSVKRADDVCAHCHGMGVQHKPNAWNPNTQTDPFRPGLELTNSHLLYWSEAELNEYKLKNLGHTSHIPEADGRFWGDGTPLTTAHEYQGMALSKCYQSGEGKMSCLTCHAMHGGDPNHQLKEGMRTNPACYTCHESYRAKLVEHTHHPAESSGSQCMNCHMPFQVFSLLDTHRTHRISSPRVRDSIDTGKPHACNLCHLDKSLGWTADTLQKWYGTKPESLSPDDRSIASSILYLTRGDARSRSVVAGAFSWPLAQQASGRDWAGMLLVRMLEQERYPAVRYLEYRALRSLSGFDSASYDYLGDSTQRSAQIRKLEMSLRADPRPNKDKYPYLPLTADGSFSNDALDRLLRSRKDPDVFVNE
jgi:predicted CXXCH cytochrome family protein